MSWWSAIGTGISYFFSLLGYWLSLFFIVPFKDPEVLWILVPIWLNLLFTDSVLSYAERGVHVLSIAILTEFIES